MVPRLQKISERLGIGDTDDCKEDELAEETSVAQIAQDLKAREDLEKENSGETVR